MFVAALRYVQEMMPCEQWVDYLADTVAAGNKGSSACVSLFIRAAFMGAVLSSAGQDLLRNFA